MTAAEWIVLGLCVFGLCVIGLALRALDAQAAEIADLRARLAERDCAPVYGRPDVSDLGAYRERRAHG